MFVTGTESPYQGTTHGRCLIFYEPHDWGICVVRVLDGARKLEDLL
jgi:hypothetical protein